MYFMRARYYDPELARFISEDPIGIDGGMNLYAYAGNNPVNFRDPYGLDTCWNVTGSQGAFVYDSKGNVLGKGDGTYCEKGKGGGGGTIYIGGGSSRDGWRVFQGGGGGGGFAFAGRWMGNTFVPDIEFRDGGFCTTDPGDPCVGVPVIGGVRSIAARSAYLRSIMDKSPRWMRGFIQQGRVPPGHQVDHIVPVSVGGSDIPANMRIRTIADHMRRHRFYRPWQR